MNVFAHLSYRAILRASLQENRATYGYKAKLAKAAGCQRSFFSQVLGERTDLMPEHAAALAHFWQLTSAGSDYFVTLVQLARAGRREYQAVLKQRLRALREEHANLSHRFRRGWDEKQSPGPMAEGAAIYYSAWYFGAIHVLTTIPAFQTARAIAERLGLTEELTQRALRSLEQLGLVTLKGTRWQCTHVDLHLPKGSPLNGLNQAMWRQIAINRIFLGKQEDLHYTSIYSMSEEDVEKVRALLLDLVEKSRRIALDSPAQDLVLLAVDFFRV